MKKLISILAAAAITAGGIGCSLAKDSDTAIKVIYDGQEMVFDVDPQIINDRTMVPMRAIFEQFGAKVKWDGDTSTITAKKKSKTITMTIGSDTASKNDEQITLDTEPQIVDGRTLVPVRAISEMLGLDVKWDEESRTVIISTPKSDDDDTWKSNTGTIDLTSMTATGGGAEVSDNIVKISKGGDFTVTGNTENGMILVDTEDKVKLRLSNANITNPSGAAIYFSNTDKGYITVTEGTENTLTSGYSEETKGAVTSKDNLEIKGSGKLTVNAANQGIHASDSLEIANGDITIIAAGDGINVNDTLEVSGGSINIASETDGMQSDEIVDITGGTINITTTGEIASSVNEFVPHYRNAETAAESADATSKGIKADWMLDISGGSISLNTTDHAIHSASDININGGEIEIAASSGKGISGHGDVTINGGNINITNATEGIESKQILTINDGNIHIVCSDDGLNAGGGNTFGGMGGGMRGGDMMNGNMPDSSMPPMEQQGGMRGGRNGMPPSDMMNGNMPDSSMSPMEQQGGMRGGRNGMSPSDMINGNMPDSSMSPMDQQQGGMRGGRNGMPPSDMMNGDMPDSSMPPMEQQGGMRGGRNGMPGGINSSTEVSTEHHIQINGGYLYIDAKGDGIDSNASIIIAGGTVIVNGPTSNGNGALDHDGLFRVDGGTLIAAGSSGMIENPSDTSAQNVLSIYLSSAQEAGTPVSVVDSSGSTLISFTPSKQYAHLFFSSDKLTTGETYSVYLGGTYSGSYSADGVGLNGSISGGTLDGEGAIESPLTTIGTATRGMGGGFGGGMPMDMNGDFQNSGMPMDTDGGSGNGGMPMDTDGGPGNGGMRGGRNMQRGNTQIR